MINWFQILMYKISCVAPIMIVTGISLYIQKAGLIWCGGFLVVGIVVSGYAFYFINLCQDKLPFITITVENIAPGDGIAMAYVATYLVPLAGIVWKDNQWIWIVIAIAGIFVLLKINVLSFNPILLLVGYHCYKASLATGMADCFVISKRNKISNKNRIKVVQRVNTFLLIDQGGK